MNQHDSLFWLYRLGMSFFLLVICGNATAISVYEFKNPQQEQQFVELGKLLRCPKCQNQNIADSNAELAIDLRQKVYQMTREGYSKEQIVDYMIARFGHFVVYEPPVNFITIFLWLGPLLLIAIGCGTLLVICRKKAPISLSVEDELKIDALLMSDERSQLCVLEHKICALEHKNSGKPE